MSGTLGASLTVVILHQQFFSMGTCVLLKNAIESSLHMKCSQKVPNIDYLKIFQLHCRSPIEKRLSM
jgi:hypothetical protein